MTKSNVLGTKPGPTPFLTAKWRDLVLITYRIDRGLLAAYLPPELEPDRRADDGADTAYVSVVAFRFLDTRLKGIAIPFHRDFPEVNLRVYVRERSGERRRGVLFIAEFVPKPAITTVANILYHENYRTVSMTAEAWDMSDGGRRMQCSIETAQQVHRIEAQGRGPANVPESDSLEHFFKEHEWGFGRDLEGRLLVYRVEHPVWAAYACSLRDVHIDFGFAELYGPPWQALQGATPFHVAFAVGSEIAVHPRQV